MEFRALLICCEYRYRNEAMDATHLAEFHQVEGVVADYDINLGHLIGMSACLRARDWH